MRLQFEKIEPGAGSSFRIIHYTEPNSCWVFWHYHPEYEIVFIPGGSGRQHIGQHRSQYTNGQLVFIGPNIPHLNFSHGAEQGFEEVVVQLRDDFMGPGFLQKPELAAVKRLFDRAKQGLSFGWATKQRVGERLRQLANQPPFERLLTLLQVCQLLASAEDAESLHADGTHFDLNPREQERINRIYQFVETHYSQPVDIHKIADLTSLTVPAFCRYFKRMTHLTFTDFVNEYRVSQARQLLHSSRTVADIGFAVGFTNLSHFNKTFKRVTGQTPSGYRNELIR